MNWILIKHRIVGLLITAAIAFEVIAVWNLLQEMYLRARKLLHKKQEAGKGA